MKQFTTSSNVVVCIANNTGDDRDLVDNYQPISIIPIIAKMSNMRLCAEREDFRLAIQFLFGQN